MNLLPVLPILFPLLFGILLLFLPKSKSSFFHFLGSTGLFVLSLILWRTVWQNGTQVLEVGNWQAPFGIAFVVDLFSASMVAITGFTAFCVSLYVWIEEKTEPKTSGLYFFANQTLLMGVCGAFLTGDLFNLYVWFEVMLMASFVLMAFEGKKNQLEGTVKYTVLNLVASAFFLIGIGLLYAAIGSLNMAHIAERLSQTGSSFSVQASFAFLLIAFGMKAGVFPLFFWLPASYHTPRVATSALLAGLLTKVGVYSLFRMSTLIFPETFEFSQTLFLTVACLTMITGVLGAAFHYDIRRILSFHIISQIGYMILGLGLGTHAAIAASLFYILHHIIVKTNLFLISGVVKHRRGTTELKKMGGLLKEAPWLGVLFLVPALSLAGMPPLSGFFAKFGLIRAGFAESESVAVTVALVVGLLTLFSMMKIWLEAFWKPQPEEFAIEKSTARVRTLLVPIAVMASATLCLGLFPDILYAPAQRMSSELLNPRAYIEAVIGKGTR